MAACILKEALLFMSQALCQWLQHLSRTFFPVYLFSHSQKASPCKVFHSWLGKNTPGTLEHTMLGDMGLWSTCLDVHLALDVSWSHLNNLHLFHWTKSSNLRAQPEYKNPDYHTTEPNLQILPMKISLAFLISSALCRTWCLFSDWSFPREKGHQKQLKFKVHL